MVKGILGIPILFWLAACTTDAKRPVNDKALKQVFAEESRYDNKELNKAFATLKAGDTLANAQIQALASSVETRADFYRLLEEYDRQPLFPKEYNNFEKASESVMTHWLMFPTELDTIPSRIEVVKRVEYPEHDTTFIYYVLKFRADPPHWAAKDGWMLGVVGPYLKSSFPYDWTSGTFSRFNKLNEISPEAEVEWVHKNCYRRGPE